MKDWKGKNLSLGPPLHDVHIQNPEVSTDKLLEYVSKVEHKFNIRKIPASVCRSNNLKMQSIYLKA